MNAPGSLRRADRFLRACRREPTEGTPIWLMRQAGRYMPEYRALRAKHGFLDMIRTPELAVEVTLQPVRAFEVDAAIVFADILPLLGGLGFEVAFEAGEGPRICNPLREPERVLSRRPMEETVGFTLDALRGAKTALAGRAPLIGFSGAPFTLACYAVEGAGSRTFSVALGFLREHPNAFHALCERLAELTGEYLRAQVDAGADALQLFDSWAGLMTPAEFETWVLPYAREAIRQARLGSRPVPVIYFSTRTASEEYAPLLRRTGADVIGLDSGRPLDEAWNALGDDVAVQGNLDPEMLLRPEFELLAAAADVLQRAGGRPGHIFNLGHGVLKETPPERVAALVDFVHARTGAEAGG
ncbi:MAG: uroporphyrinogen decarboxylase [Kiritimatiellae bacterium]|nr:uroporphyrinogen decarboxylase [Kiritimatiellia bacterium]